MNNFNRIAIPLLLFLGIASLALLGPARVAGQTIPTRTPTPDSDGATSPGSSDDDDNNDNNGGGNSGGDSSQPSATPTTASSESSELPTPTSTTQAPATATATAISALSQNESVAAAGCDEAPTARALALTMLRAGPGIEYESLSSLDANTVRPIVGRAEHGPWWLINLVDGTEGWIADEDVLVQGDTSSVPLVAAPPLGGNTPTPGAPWEPTPLPVCTITPSPTPTSTPTSTPLPVPTTEPDAAVAEVSADENDVPPDEQPPSAQPEAVVKTAGSAATPAPAAALELPAGARTPNFLPILGLLLVAGGVFLLLVRRQRAGGA